MATEQMKICFTGVCETFPSYAGENTRILQLSNALVKLGHDVHIIVPKSRKQIDAAYNDNTCLATVHMVAVKGVPSRPYGFTFKAQLDFLRRLHNKEGFDLLHANMFWGGIFGILARNVLKIQTVFDPHDWYFCEIYNFPLYNDDFVERYCANRLDATLVTGHGLADHLLENSFSKKVYVVPNGVNEALLNHTHEYNQIASATKSSPVLVFLGALTYCQGADLLIQALGRIHNSAQLLIIGDGPERQRLEYITKTEGLEKRVTFTGRVPWNTLLALLDSADLAVAPFRSDRYTNWIQPVKVFEYFARSKPVIASALPGVSELVKDGQNGLLVPSQNIGVLSTACDYLLGNAALRHKMGTAGRTLVEQEFTWNKSADRLVQVYESILRR